MSNIPQWSCEKFADETFSSAPVPGGGFFTADTCIFAEKMYNGDT